MKRFFSCQTAVLLLLAIPGTAYFIYDHLSYQRRQLEEARSHLQTLTQKGGGKPVPAGIVNIPISLDEIKRIVAALDLGQSGSTTTGLASWLAYEPIPSAGWTLLNTYIKSDVPSNGEVLRRQLLPLAGARFRGCAGLYRNSSAP
jgi:hypothetical protein